MQLSLFFVLLTLTWFSVTSDEGHKIDLDKIELEIYGGTVSKPNKWPFMAAIFVFESWWKIWKTRKQFHCGGVVWNEDTILTAAHCVNSPRVENDAGKLRVLLGHSNIDSYDSKYMFKVKQFHKHEQYSRSIKNRNDIAILKLASKIDFQSDRIRCVCEPEPLVHIDRNRCIALGWGKVDEKTRTSSDLREVVLPLLPPEVDPFECTMAPDKEVCAGGIVGRDTCGGDSGGPLICPLLNHSTVYTLVGLNSRGPPCNQGGYGIYTKVHHYLPWIAKYAGED